MGQDSFCEIAFSHWLRRVTCRSVIVSVLHGSVQITGFVNHFVYKRTTKGNYEKPQKLSEFCKFSTKSRMSWTMNNLKDSFTIMKANITTRQKTLKLTIQCECHGVTPRRSTA